MTIKHSPGPQVPLEEATGKTASDDPNNQRQESADGRIFDRNTRVSARPTTAMPIRTYDHGRDWAALWRMKQAFERELGTETGPDAKAARYEGKLTDAYRERYRDWVERSLAEEPDCIRLAVPEREPVGYAFVLPESHAMIWDAAVLNELYLAPAHRGDGLADDLMAAAIEVVRGQSLPMDRLVLDVDPNNDRARAFYDRHDFEPWGEMVARKLE
jgi:ribosomal protein S18 acetylase RimI-like enzyme